MNKIATREDGLKRLRNTLAEGGYRRIAAHILRAVDGKTKTGELWVYGNGREVLLVQTYFDPREGITGWDVYAPITASNKVDDTLAAIQERAIAGLAA